MKTTGALFPENVCLQLKSSQKALLKKDLDAVDRLVDGCFAVSFAT